MYLSNHRFHIGFSAFIVSLPTQCVYTPWAKFSKLLRKILGKYVGKH